MIPILSALSDISINDISMNEVNNFIIDTDLDSTIVNLNDFDTLTLGDRVRQIGNVFLNGFKNSINLIREGRLALAKAVQALDHLNTEVYELTQNNNLDGVDLNDYVAGIRWAAGDLVFTEIYVFLLISITFVIFMLFSKIVQLIKYILQYIFGNEVLMDVTNQPILNWIIRIFKI